MNRLYYGDCLAVMQEMNLNSADLIYLDPPWNSNRAYNAIYRDSTGLELPDQIEAFCDIWELTPERESMIRNMPVLMAQAGIEDSASKLWQLWMQALRNTQPRLLAYLLYMTERLIVMKGLLRPTGSIFLHCDPTAAHYIKTLMDAIFGHRSFRNEIIWCYTGPGSPGIRQFLRKHDTIFWYSKGQKWTFNRDEVRIPHAAKTKANYKGGKLQGSGFTGADHVIDAKGKVPEDWWQMAIAPRGKEYLGYPTQKPIALLKRIIQAASNEGDRVLDPFCGCATTIAAAHELNRQWIGIDIAYHAIRRVAQVRLQDDYGLVEGQHYTVTGVPRTLEGAQSLWRQDKYQFQRWAVEQVNGFVTTKRTADGGIDGRLYFALPGENQMRSMVIEVKGGRNIGVNVIRSLVGVLNRDEATMAGLITMEPLSDRQRQSFMREISHVGMLDVMGVQYPRIQMLSVHDIIARKSFLTPTVAGRGKRQGVLPLDDTRRLLI